MRISQKRPADLEPEAPFILKKVDDDETSASTNDSSFVRNETQAENVKSSLPRRTPRVNNGSTSTKLQIVPCKRKLPRGVIRGCKECDDCQKVIAKWCPEEACRPDLEEAPVFYPTEKEFEDPIKYIASIRIKAEGNGICRIVPPPSWKPPCPLKQEEVWENTKFPTRVQKIHELQNRDAMKKSKTKHQKKKRRICKKNEDNEASNGEEDEGFGFEPGPDFTLEEFQAYDHEFKTQYFRGRQCASSKGNWTLSVEDIEGEYWRMVQKPTEKIEVLYGADLQTGEFSSGFPKNTDQAELDSDAKYINSGWNLNNFPRLSGSLLSYECSDITGVLVPWLYVGMCFSSFCWHVEDHHLYSLNYMHWGEPKVWYGVPSTAALKLEATMKKHLPDLFEEQPDLLHKLVTQISPTILKNEGVPVYRCVQYPGEFVLTFPRAYHAGFNCGFNCAEAVNVAPIDWLPFGQNAIEVYKEEGRKSTISHDKLLLGASRDAIKAQWELILLKRNTPENLRWRDVCGKNGMLSMAFKSRVETEKKRRESLCKSLQTLKMESSFDETDERECSVCLYDLHLSAAGCHKCSPKKYACLNHVDQLCSCPKGTKFYLFRYELDELNLLVDALGGKLSAIYKWARMEGLKLSSYTSKQNSKPESEQIKPSFQEKVEVIRLSDDEATTLRSKIWSINAFNGSKRRDEQRGLAWGSLGKRARKMANTSSWLLFEATDNKLTRKDNVQNDGHVSSQQVDARNANETGNRKSESKPESRPVDDTHNGLDRHLGQGSPRVIEFGVVQNGKSWCDTRAIYPKGFKSRVRYISVVDPTRTCYYDCEIHDVGHDRPLFMVSMEDSSEEVFAHVSAVKCWEMIRKKVNEEITKHHKLSIPNLPPLQLPGSLDAMEMFGFTSPDILRVIEAMDHNRVCTEYWKSRHPSSSNGNNESNSCLKPEESESNDQQKSKNNTLLHDTVDVLMKKATQKEMYALHSIIDNNGSKISRLVNREIDQRLR